MNYPKAGLVVMFILGLVSMFPAIPEGDPVTIQPTTASWQPAEPIGQQVPPPKAPSEPAIHPQRYGGLNACRRADGRFVGVVRETFRKDGEWFYKIEPPNARRTYTVEDLKSGKVTKHSETQLITGEVWKFTVTQFTCTDGHPSKDNAIRVGKRTEEIIK